MHYRHSPGVGLHETETPPYFTTPEGGVIVTDVGLAKLWRTAHASSLHALVATPMDPVLAGIVPEALACLAEAGLLRRDLPRVAGTETRSEESGPGPLVSVIVVVSSPREMEFLDDCLASVATTRYRPIELVVVDNASGAVVRDTAQRYVPDVVLMPLKTRRRLAHACNVAIAKSNGEYLLLMNPDVKLHEDAIGRLVERASTDERTAAVVPKTRFWRAPSFLNAIGNRVPPRNWGTDNAIGHLDLGQFDRWQHVPSASLTVQLMARRAWEDVGPIDEAFPAYYEDADWAYRARLAGWKIGVMPEAEAFHIFGGFWDAAEGGGLTPGKLRTAIIGRLRFTIRIAGGLRLRTHLKNYFFEDLGNVITDCRCGHYASALNYPRAWVAVALQLPGLLAQRRRLQLARQVSDDTLFPAEDSMPRSYVLRNSPLLTSSIVRSEYAPLLRRGETRTVPELIAG